MSPKITSLTTISMLVADFYRLGQSITIDILVSHWKVCSECKAKEDKSELYLSVNRTEGRRKQERKIYKILKK